MTQQDGYRRSAGSQEHRFNIPKKLVAKSDFLDLKRLLGSHHGTVTKRKRPPVASRPQTWYLKLPSVGRSCFLWLNYNPVEKKRPFLGLRVGIC